MNQPWWKRTLSYAFEWHIESAPSELNPHLYVSLRRGRYQLNTANAVYSFEDRYDNFRLLFKRWNFKDQPPKRVLLLGFGLGSVCQLLDRYCPDIIEITGVEKDDRVIYLAARYTMPKMKNPITIVEADAVQFVSNCNETFDLVISDIFVDDVIPDAFKSASYVKMLDELLTKNGSVIINTLANSHEDQQRSNEFYNEIFKGIYPQALSLPMAKNYMLISNPIYLRH